MLCSLASRKKSTPNSFVFQMCELEVGMSLVKVMTNGGTRVKERESGVGWERQSKATWGANMPSMPADFTDPRLRGWKPMARFHSAACVCMCGRCGHMCM